MTQNKIHRSSSPSHHSKFVMYVMSNGPSIDQPTKLLTSKGRPPREQHLLVLWHRSQVHPLLIAPALAAVGVG
jgi:hypothetical protein